MSCGGQEDYIELSPSVADSLNNWSRQYLTSTAPPTFQQYIPPGLLAPPPLTTTTFSPQTFAPTYAPTYAPSRIPTMAPATASEKIKWYTWLVLGTVGALLVAIVAIIAMRAR